MRSIVQYRMSNNEYRMNTEKSNAFICGTVRNCEQWLDAVFGAIEQMEPVFNKIHIIIAYDDSNDKSLAKLVRYKSIYKERMDIHVNRDPLSHRRTENIANARNVLLDSMKRRIAENPLEDWPYFIMMDMDDVCAKKVNVDVLQSVLNRSDEWDTISFNRQFYYDIWALSLKPYIYSCWGWERPQLIVDATRHYITKIMLNIRKDQLLECQSAFNGIAIYKTSIFLKCRYDWRMPKEYMLINDLLENQRVLGNPRSLSPLAQKTDEPDCEHRSFHMSAIANYGARVRISPECIFF